MRVLFFEESQVELQVANFANHYYWGCFMIPLVNVYKTMEDHHFFNGKIHDISIGPWLSLEAFPDFPHHLGRNLKNQPRKTDADSYGISSLIIQIGCM